MRNGRHKPSSGLGLPFRIPHSAFRILVLLALAPSQARAGVYLAGEPVPFAVVGGAAEELPYEPRFKGLLGERFDTAIPAAPDPAPRNAALARLAGATDAVERAALELRLGRADDALNRLGPAMRARPDFLGLLALAQAHAARGEWREAREAQAAAFFDAEPPAVLPGATAEQTKWLLEVERKYVARWLAVRAAEPAKGFDAQPPPDVFQGVRFVGESGGYEPGKLARGERAKLPADAVAVAQQLALWAPADTRLLWLVGELYAADERRLRDAEKVFEQCVARQFTNRPVLMAHRQAVRDAVLRLPPESIPVIPDDPTPAAKPDGGLPREVVPVAAGVFAVALVMVALQVRAWTRRARR